MVRSRSQGEKGAILLVLMVGVVVTMILMGAVAQTWSTIAIREREAEFIFRGRQYAQAIKLYQEDHGALPTKMEQLLEPGPKGNSRYIRREWKDPLTGGDWVLLWLAPDGASLFRSDGKPSTSGAFRTAPAGASNLQKEAVALNMQQLTIPPGSPGYDPDQNKSIMDAYKRSRKEKVGSFIARNRQGGFDSESSLTLAQGVGPIAGVATAMEGDAFLEWKGRTNYSGYEISIFSEQVAQQQQVAPGLAPERNVWEMPGRPVPDPLSKEGKDLYNTGGEKLGGGEALQPQGIKRPGSGR